MRDDHATGRKRRIDRCEATGNIFIGQAMEAIASDPLIVECARDGEARGEFWPIMVKGRVEAGDLRQVWCERGNRPDCGQIVGLVQRAGVSAETCV